MNSPMTVAHLRKPQSDLATLPDQSIDMFTERGFVLANRIAKAYASADAVPAAFRSQVLKKSRDGDVWVENPSAIGNCLVAIETARAVGMSITAVMQNSNVIEGRLSWSAQFVIAAINASGRFHPLRFDIKKRGPITAKYREKQGWNKAKGGYDFLDVEVKIDDEVCVAWTLPKGAPIPPNIYTLDQARAANLPVIESAPVSMKLAVEEGWYGKSGSKWQTEMKALMLQYRAGSFFGRIHAPDIVMGMGRTTEELADIVDVLPNGSYTVSAETLRTDMRQVDADGVITHDPSPTMQTQTVQAQQREEQAQQVEQAAAQQTTVAAAQTAQKAEQKAAPAQQRQATPAFSIDAFADSLERCTDQDTLSLKVDEVNTLLAEGTINQDEADSLFSVYRHRQAVLNGQTDLLGGGAPAKAAAPAAAPATTRRRSSSAGTAPE